MKTNSLIVAAAVILFLGCSFTSVAQERKVSAELWKKVSNEQPVRVLVMLQEPEIRGTKEQTIIAIQDELLAELTGTPYRITGRFKTIFGIGLEVGPDALMVLERSSRVTQIKESLPDHVPPSWQGRP